MIIKINNPPFYATSPKSADNRASAARWFLDQLPPHHAFVTPMGIGTATFLRKNPAPVEVVNDTEGDIDNFLHVLRHREQAEHLLDRLETNQPVSIKADGLLGAPDPIERARRFFVLAREAFGPGLALSTARTVKRCFDGRFGQFEPLVRRLQMIQVENLEVTDILQRYDAWRTLFFVEHIAQSDTDNAMFYQQLRTLRGKVVLCGPFSNTLTETHLSGWRCVRHNCADQPQLTCWVNFPDYAKFAA